MAESTSCEVCGTEIEGEAFTLSALTEPPSLLAACETCASSPYITIRYDGMKIRIDRDDYIRADHERLHIGLDKISAEMDYLGWTLEAVRLHASSDAVTEPYEE
jgi:ribosome-binding protein aMBF1 (putative translation factor)